jgi:hypothetical protein
MKLLLIILLWWVGFPRECKHDFHASKCLLEFSERHRSLQATVHIFIDDLEEALRRQGVDQLFICTEKEAKDAEAHIARYLARHLQVKVNGKPANFEFIGKEIADEYLGMWCYLEAAPIERPERLEITNTILLEVFDDQRNIVSIRGPNNRKGALLLKKGRVSADLAF